jgi:imidazole glycerol-phosphate synthase subunit HisF
MLRPRIVPALLIHEGGLVKTTGFQQPKYVGDPINAIRIFNEKEADELIVIDIDATVLGAQPNVRLIRQFAAECRMPICYGGGVKSVEQANHIIGLGIEKVAVSSAAIERPQLIQEIAAAVGGQSVVVVLDVKQNPVTKTYEVWTHNGKRNTGQSVLALAREAEARGAGEIVINSIDRDGQMQGYDLALAQAVRDAVRSPMTMLGGAGSLVHIQELISRCGVVGAAAGSFFVFKGARRAVLISYPDQAQKEQVVAAALNPMAAAPG